MRRRIAVLGGVMLLMTLVACSSTPTATSAKRGTTRSTSTTSTHPSTTTAAAHPTTTTTAPPPLPMGAQGAVSAIPWTQVGSGWLLALWAPNSGGGAGSLPAGDVPTVQETTTLFLVDPLGGRYLVATLAPPAPSSLAGWSGDGRRALLTSISGSQTTVTQIDLTTGQTVNQFALNGGVSYTRPMGLAVLATSSTATTPTATTLQRYGMDGSLQQAYPTNFSQVGAFDGSVLPSPDGTQLVMGAAKGLALVGNRGTLVSQLPVAGATNCTVTRWWATGVALASCLTTGSSSRLYEVPISGAAVTTLTAPPVPPDYGDLNAWEVGNNAYLQNAGACGSLFLGELQPNGTSEEVTVPDVDSGSSVVVVGTDGSRLALRATVACGSGISAMWFNPTENSTSVVLGPPVNGGGVIAALVYPSPLD